jgi:hypothetical protein
MTLAIQYQNKARYWAEAARYARDVLLQKSTAAYAQENAAHYARYAREVMGIDD